jgi:hypothetical protein
MLTSDNHNSVNGIREFGNTEFPEHSSSHHGA